MNHSSVNFIFAIHSHQPVGNFPYIFERAYQDCYKPFLELVSEFPFFKFSLHYSGCLLDWIEENHPEHIELIQRLVNRGQLEIIGGAYYEPILTCIPSSDAIAQIELYSEHLKKLFGKKPEGLWLAERVWSPELAKVLADARVKFTLLDDNQFLYGGLNDEELFDYFYTEREGKTISIFPIHRALRYAIPFHEKEEIINYLAGWAKRAPGAYICYGDDGEKFGVWPGTNEHVYKNEWLKNFIQSLAENQHWLKLRFFSECLKEKFPRDRVYLPPSSYEEMMEWVLPPKRSKIYEELKDGFKQRSEWERVHSIVRGGHWEMFLAKYPEANWLQKRMLRTSEKLKKAKGKKFERAQKELFKAQCNCAYWHGIFGGLYLSHLRDAIYNHLLRAEEILAEGKKDDKAIVEEVDFDRDGHNELLIETKNISAYFHPHLGGSLFLLEYRPAHFSLTNLIARREESYHRLLVEAEKKEVQEPEKPKTIHERVIVKEEGLLNYLVYDPYPRLSLIEHFFAELDGERFKKRELKELGEFAGMPYELTDLASSKEKVKFQLIRKAKILDGEDGLLVELKKNIKLDVKNSEFQILYTITPLQDTELFFLFAIEFNYTLLSPKHNEKFIKFEPGSIKIYPIEYNEIKSAKRAIISDLEKGFQLEIKSKEEARWLNYPVETVSQSESGFERTYQGSCLTLFFPVELKAKNKVEKMLTLKLKPLKSKLAIKQ